MNSNILCNVYHLSYSSYPSHSESYHGLPAWIEFPSHVKARICCLQLPISQLTKKNWMAPLSSPCMTCLVSRVKKHPKLTKASRLKPGNQLPIWPTQKAAVECSQGNHWIWLYVYMHSSTWWLLKSTGFPQTKPIMSMFVYCNSLFATKNFISLIKMKMICMKFFLHQTHVLN